MTASSLAREAVGAPYSLAAIREAQAMTWQAVDRIAAAMRPGMNAVEAEAAGNAVLEELGLERNWHPVLVRIGSDTLKIFSDKADPAVVLGEDDIFFIDIGPVFLGHEGDAGATYTIGGDAEMRSCAEAVKTLFDRVRAIWDGGVTSGADLYARAEQEARDMGWLLNLDIRGHRVSDFPHAVHQGGQLGDFAAVPGAGLWILEMQIRHPTRPFGAFHEDLLA